MRGQTATGLEVFLGNPSHRERSSKISDPAPIEPLPTIMACRQRRTRSLVALGSEFVAETGDNPLMEVRDNIIAVDLVGRWV
jgi:hypothetical protein